MWAKCSLLSWYGDKNAYWYTVYNIHYISMALIIWQNTVHNGMHHSGSKKVPHLLDITQSNDFSHITSMYIFCQWASLMKWQDIKNTRDMISSIGIHLSKLLPWAAWGMGKSHSSSIRNNITVLAQQTDRPTHAFCMWSCFHVAQKLWLSRAYELE